MGTDAKKNLIYFIYFNGTLNHYHILNLELLNKHFKLFNGKKIIKIAVDREYDLDPITSLLPKGAKYQVVANDRLNGEAIHFIDSLNQVDKGITFYAHCKGVSRPKMSGLDTWVTKLYDLNLGTVPTLTDSLFSGICGKLLACPPYVPQPFHYSGSFYWLNTEKVKEKIKELPINKYLTERFPAMFSSIEQCNFGYGTSTLNLNFYEQRTWDRLLIL